MYLPPTFELVRPLNCLLAGAAVLIGAIVTFGGCGLPGATALLAFGAAALIAAGGNAINDYFDRKIDKINRPWRPIPSGRVRAGGALKIAQLLFVLGIALTIFLNLYCILLAYLNSLMLTLYSWKLKRGGLVGNLSIGYLVGSTFLFGGLAVGGLRYGPLIPTELLVLVFMAAFSTVGRELIKAIEDMRGDRKFGFGTFPLRYGPRKAAVLAAFFIGAAIALSPLPYSLGIFDWPYLIFAIPSIAFFISAISIIARKQKRKSAELASSACKIAMGLGLLAFLAGVVSPPLG